jgi:hypothetical protein
MLATCRRVQSQRSSKNRQHETHSHRLRKHQPTACIRSKEWSFIALARPVRQAHTARATLHLRKIHQRLRWLVIVTLYFIAHATPRAPSVYQPRRRGRNHRLWPAIPPRTTSPNTGHHRNGPSNEPSPRPTARRCTHTVGSARAGPESSADPTRPAETRIADAAVDQIVSFHRGSTCQKHDCRCPPECHNQIFGAQNV